MALEPSPASHASAAATSSGWRSRRTGCCAANDPAPGRPYSRADSASIDVSVEPGLTAFAVLTFRHGTGGQLLSDALDAGAAQLTFRDGIGAVASAPLVNLVLVHPYASPDTFLLVGLVSQTALEQAATVLAAKPDQDQ